MASSRVKKVKGAYVGSDSDKKKGSGNKSQLGVNPITGRIEPGGKAPIPSQKQQESPQSKRIRELLESGKGTITEEQARRIQVDVQRVQDEALKKQALEAIKQRRELAKQRDLRTATQIEIFRRQGKLSGVTEEGIVTRAEDPGKKRVISGSTISTVPRSATVRSTFLKDIPQEDKYFFSAGINKKGEVIAEGEDGTRVTFKNVEEYRKALKGEIPKKASSGMGNIGTDSDTASEKSEPFIEFGRGGVAVTVNPGELSRYVPKGLKEFKEKGNVRLKEQEKQLLSEGEVLAQKKKKGELGKLESASFAVTQSAFSLIFKPIQYTIYNPGETMGGALQFSSELFGPSPVEQTPEKLEKNYPTITEFSSEFSASPLTTGLETLGSILLFEGLTRGVKKAIGKEPIDKRLMEKIASREGYEYDITPTYATELETKRFGIIKETVPTNIKRVGARGLIKGEKAKGSFYEQGGKTLEVVQKIVEGEKYLVKRTTFASGRTLSQIFKVEHGTGELFKAGEVSGKLTKGYADRSIGTGVELERTTQTKSKTPKRGIEYNPIYEAEIPKQKSPFDIVKSGKKILELKQTEKLHRAKYLTGEQKELLRRLSATREIRKVSQEATPEVITKSESFVQSRLKAKQTRPGKETVSLIEGIKGEISSDPFKLIKFGEKADFYDLFLGEEKYISRKSIPKRDLGVVFEVKDGKVNTIIKGKEIRKIPPEIRKTQTTTVQENIKVRIPTKEEANIINKILKDQQKKIKAEQKKYNNLFEGKYTDLSTWKEVFGDTRKPVIDKRGRILSIKSIENILKKAKKKTIKLNKKSAEAITKRYAQARTEILNENPELAQAVRTGTLTRLDKYNLERLINKRAEELLLGKLPEKKFQYNKKYIKLQNEANKRLRELLRKKDAEDLRREAKRIRESKIPIPKSKEEQVVIVEEPQYQRGGGVAIDFAFPRLELGGKEISKRLQFVPETTQIKRTIPKVFYPAKSVGKTTKIESLLKSEQKITPINAIKSAVKSKINQKTFSKQNLNLEQNIEQSSKLKNELNLNIKSKSELRNKLEQKTEITQELKQEQKSRLDTTTSFSPFALPPIVPIRNPPIKPIIRSNKEKIVSKPYSVRVRRKGIFTEFGKFGTASEAFKAGAETVDVTSAASFFVEGPTGRVRGAFQFISPRKFRPSKREPGVIVERSKFRISTPGEIGQITAKGIAKSRRRKKPFDVFS